VSALDDDSVFVADCGQAVVALERVLEVVVVIVYAVESLVSPVEELDVVHFLVFADAEAHDEIVVVVVYHDVVFTTAQILELQFAGGLLFGVLDCEFIGLLVPHGVLAAELY